MSHPSPQSSDYQAWALLARAVTDALRSARIEALYSRRTAVAEYLWEKGMRLDA